jgi:hypothetical protein
MREGSPKPIPWPSHVAVPLREHLQERSHVVVPLREHLQERSHVAVPLWEDLEERSDVAVPREQPRNSFGKMQAVEASIGGVFHGRYQIVRKIAAGGMATVYEAVDLRTHRRRALKVMLPELARDPDLASRFALEARVTADVPSENIVETFDAGVDRETRSPFLVMELLLQRPSDGARDGANLPLVHRDRRGQPLLDWHLQPVRRRDAPRVRRGRLQRAASGGRLRPG